MAKGNLFLGTARRRVGDVVLYRRNGQQISRAYVAKVSNPKTAAQAQVRAGFAPVSKFYSPLSIVLEKSFEGLNKSASYQKFLGENIKLAINNRWYLPKGSTWQPLPYIVSRGSLPTIAAEVAIRTDKPTGFELLVPDAILPTPSVATMGDISKGLMAKGFEAGDQCTIILASEDGMGGYYPVYARFIIQPESTEVPSEVLPQFTFRMTEDYMAIGLTDGYCDGGCIIRSKFANNVWRRSTQQFLLHQGYMDGIANGNISSEGSYMNDETTTGSDVYLNYGNSLFSSTSDGRSFRLDRITTLVVNIDPEGNELRAIVAEGKMWNGSRYMFFTNGFVAEGAEDYGDMLVPGNTWADVSYNSKQAEAEAVRLNLVSNTGDVARWLQQQGIPASVFTLGAVAE